MNERTNDRNECSRSNHFVVHTERIWYEIVHQLRREAAAAMHIQSGLVLGPYYQSYPRGTPSFVDLNGAFIVARSSVHPRRNTARFILNRLLPTHSCTALHIVPRNCSFFFPCRVAAVAAARANILWVVVNVEYSKNVRRRRMEGTEGSQLTMQ